uniref:Uncharacterized protein n=1 Tax=Schistocephalus solidus TaxID=70667 RepID=A0A0X3PS51_SCHSO
MASIALRLKTPNIASVHITSNSASVFVSYQVKNCAFEMQTESSRVASVNFCGAGGVVIFVVENKESPQLFPVFGSFASFSDCMVVTVSFPIPGRDVIFLYVTLPLHGIVRLELRES